MQASPRPDEIQGLISLFKDGQLTQLEPLARRFSQAYPGHGLGWMLLGAIHKAARRHEEALEAQLNALKVMPPKAELYSNLGNIQFALDRLPEAEASYRKCLQLDPRHVNGLFNLGLLLLSARRPQEAERYLRQALALNPNSEETLYQTALSLLEQEQFSKALPLLRQAIALRPGYAEAHDSLSFALLGLGDVEKACEAGERAVALKPDEPQLLGNLVFTRNYQLGEATDNLALVRSYGELVSSRAAAQRFASWKADAPADRLKIGFVSGDFKNHPVAYFLLGLLQQIDRTQFECFAYSAIRFEDDWTQKIKREVSCWKVLPATSDFDAAQQIHEDGIHILVDLAGHTGHGRLPIFAFRPAPVQVSWLGYFSTTGVPQVDYLLADETGAPAQDSTQFTEAVWRLPQTRLCFTPSDAAPDVAPAPMLKNQYPTFGCYQSLPKVNDAVLECWKPIFEALPKTRLRWQCAQFADGDVRKAAQLRLRRHGIGDSRVQLLKAEGRQEYLASHRHVDFILDTFPFPGGTTTCEALWMGVPTLTLAGSTLLSRQGESLLTAAGLADWIARGTADYQRKAIAFASDAQALAELRAGLRPKVAKSPLFDNARFARNFEEAMWAIWRKSATVT